MSIQTQTQGQHRCQKIRKILKNHVLVSDFATMLLDLRKTEKSQKICKQIFFFRKKMQFDIKETLFRILFFHPWYLHSRKYIFDLKFTIKGSVIMKWGHGCKIWDWSIILHYFAEYLTCMLTLGLRSYRSSNLVIDLKMWEKFESNLPVCLLCIIASCMGNWYWQSTTLFFNFRHQMKTKNYVSDK